jgi:hypothetical protein
MVLLIYDDTCYLCGKFANTARRLSRGHVDIVGHYSKEGISAKNRIFPVGFDPTTMFWLVKGKQAFGGRSGLLPVAVEILKGIFRPSSGNIESINVVCSNDELVCNTPADFVKRVSMLMKNGKKIEVKV